MERSDVLGIPRPAWRGVLHAGTFFLALPAGALLILLADRPMAQAAASVYAASVAALFGTSAAYHRLARSERTLRVMRRLDHAMIFVLIGGTYTPVCLVALPLAWGIPILAVVGSGCVAGFVLKLAAFDRLRWMSYALYPILGWGALVALPALAQHVSGLVLALVVAGGVCYTLGLPVLLLRRPNPWPRRFGYHEIWHAFTVAAGACHFVAIFLLIR